MKRVWLLPFVCVLLVLSTAPALAQVRPGGQTVIGEPVVVESGETSEGNLIAVGGPVTVEEEGRVAGDILAWGGTVDIAGRVDGNVVVWGGSVQLRATAVIDGDLILVGGRLRRAKGAVVRGEIIDRFPFGGSGGFRLDIFRPPVLPVIPEQAIRVDDGSGFLTLLISLIRIGLTAVGTAVIGILVMIFLPRHTENVKAMATDQPVASVGVGLLTLIVAVLVLGLLIITICGIPIAFILGLALLMAGLFGWIALGLLIGEQLLRVLSVEKPLPLVSVVIGVLLISVLSAIPCLGWIFAFFGGSLGLGAVVLTRAGSRSYPSLPGGRVLGPPPEVPPAAPAAEGNP